MPPTVSEGGIVFCLQFYRKHQRCVSLGLCRRCIRQPWGEPKGAITEMLWHYAVVPIQFWGSSIKGNFYWQVFKGCYLYTVVSSQLSLEIMLWKEISCELPSKMTTTGRTMQVRSEHGCWLNKPTTLPVGHFVLHLCCYWIACMQIHSFC